MRAVHCPLETAGLHGDDLGRDQHELGKAAVMLVAHVLPPGAHRRVARLALPAGPARDRGDHLNAVPGGPAWDRSAGADHLAGDLMAKHPWRAQPVVPVLDRLAVGAADGAIAHADHHVAWPRLRIGDLLDPHIPRLVEAGS